MGWHKLRSNNKRVLVPKESVAMKETVYSRADLERFKTTCRTDVFAALRSFDGNGLTDDAFA